MAATTAAVFVVYQWLILGILVTGLGGAPNYVRRYPAWENARRIVRLTPSAADAATLIGREPLLEYGRRHPAFGVAVWSYELTWSSLVFFLSFSALSRGGHRPRRQRCSPCSCFCPPAHGDGRK